MLCAIIALSLIPFHYVSCQICNWSYYDTKLLINNYILQTTTTVQPVKQSGTWGPWYTVVCDIRRVRYDRLNPSFVEIQNIKISNLKLCDSLSFDFKQESILRYNIQKIDNLKEIKQETNKKLNKTIYQQKRSLSRTYGSIAILVICLLVTFIISNDIINYVHKNYENYSKYFNRLRARKQIPEIPFDTSSPFKKRELIIASDAYILEQFRQLNIQIRENRLKRKSSSRVNNL